ncbi:hypothetical protein O6P43_001651 [Quillaja saponaria]|uniref:Uncharacterized protein n=1 Tax=Quillaja saponaria TaxID=32244 RepID=A0AAD7VNY4_QUISA|nr:hypothetical protein O6P43_001651 [Quillaja saponaria]
MSTKNDSHDGVAIADTYGKGVIYATLHSLIPTDGGFNMSTPTDTASPGTRTSPLFGKEEVTTGAELLTGMALRGEMVEEELLSMC